VCKHVLNTIKNIIQNTYIYIKPLYNIKLGLILKAYIVATSLLEECEDDIHTPEMGTWEPFGTLEILEFDCKGQNTSP
jgi:hypothetical protein